VGQTNALIFMTGAALGNDANQFQGVVHGCILILLLIVFLIRAGRAD
jgi:hypothetical protein